LPKKISIITAIGKKFTTGYVFIHCCNLIIKSTVEQKQEIFQFTKYI